MDAARTMRCDAMRREGKDRPGQASDGIFRERNNAQDGYAMA